MNDLNLEYFRLWQLFNCIGFEVTVLKPYNASERHCVEPHHSLSPAQDWARLSGLAENPDV